jgi:segregation and condensation protein B
MTDDHDENQRPFSVVVSDKESPAAERPTPEDDDDWSPDDLEAEYLRAVEAAEQAELISELTFDELGAPIPEPETAAQSLAETPPPAPAPAADLAVALPEVLEAMIFVGGAALTSKRLAELTGASPDEVDEHIAGINRRYLAEDRAYEIRLADGGYRLAVTPAFETIRNRVHGQAPKEVKLTPDVLEILALIAYEQPVSREQLAATNKPEADSIVRQLVRRDLVTIHRGEDGKSVSYGTTPRLLELFGLRSLNDLPRAEDFRFK